MGFLDRRPFPASEPDGKELLDALMKAYWKSSAVVAFVQNAGLPLARFRWDATMDEVWPDVLSLAADRGRLRVLVTAVAGDPNSAAYTVIARLVEEPAPQTDGGADAYTINLLGRGRHRLAFIDRDDLREYLADLAQEDRDRVLVVTGADGSGKSHTWHLIQHVADCVVGTQPGLADLSRWSGEPAGPYDVMELVANALTLAGLPPRDPLAHPDNQAGKLLKWFTGQLRDLDDPLWLVFDEVEHSPLTEAGARLVRDIADAARTNQAGKLRVLMLAGPPPPTGEYNVVHEAISPVGLNELGLFFRGAARQAGEQINEDGLKVLLQTLFDGAPPVGPICLAEMGPRAARLAQQTFGI